ncbi:hypothetical protein Pcinc_042038 [Petrolisthes cinctipes]|uniref:Uncharacterized protein n=1 Tax=Petrolisthes cinctipes TaxID=88211 RepID=A0AAE1EJ93_PETCI|nr:hypothetical protein Pcinc_042038 [Petrolisthes cinctipes]
MPPAIKLYLEEKEPSDIHNAAILAENYVLTHKGGSFPTVTRAGELVMWQETVHQRDKLVKVAGEGVVQCMFRPNCEDITVGEQCLNGSGIAGVLSVLSTSCLVGLCPRTDQGILNIQ